MTTSTDDAAAMEMSAEPVAAAPLITVVITNYNRRDDLREALQSILGQDYPQVAIIVVDNASHDGSKEMVTEEFPQVELIALDDNPGMAGYSVGFERVRGELIFQMDNDSLMPNPQVLSTVAQRFAEGPENLAAVACRVEEYRPGKDRVEDLRAKTQDCGPIDTGGFHSGGVGFRTELLKQAGFYHRDVFLYASELFLEMKLLAHGSKIHYFPEILMLHKSSGVSRSALGVYYELRNRYWFMRRFADSGQRRRYLPQILLHDTIYALFKRRPGAFLRALKDGFGPMPEDLGPLRSPRAQFQARVREFGSWFGPSALLRRIWQRVLP